MTDRELLELAAKAAGIKYDAKASQPHPVSGAFFGLWLMIHGEPYEGQRRWWNPLTNDGDALRLAVKLSIPLSPESVNGSTWVCRGDVQIRESHASDPYAATRLAITRVAAEIGKDMP